MAPRRQRRASKPASRASAGGRKGPAREPASGRARTGLGAVWRTARRYSFLIVFVVVVGGGALFGALHGAALRDDGFEATSTPAPTPSAAPAVPGDDQHPDESARDLFAHACGTCHTLRAAGAGAGIGPNLDRVRPHLTARRVRDQIRTGTFDSAMPPNLLLGRDADRVAQYVARVAGHKR